MPLTQTDRNYGLDLLRCLAMYLIVVLHVMSIGCLWNGERGTGKWLGVGALFALSRCAVNIYALLSGYCGYGRKHGWKKLFRLWGVTVFWGLLIYLVFDAMQGHFSARHILYGLMPITFSNYWYFTAYCLLFPLMPWLDKGITEANPRQLLSALGFLGLCFCILPLVSENILPQVGFILRPATGSFVWLGYLYCLGATMQHYNLAAKIPIWIWIVIAISCLCFLTVSCTKASLAYRWKFLCSHYSPLCLSVAVSLLVIFSRFSHDIPGLVKMSACTFAIYIIHFHPMVQSLLSGKITMGSNSPTKLLVAILGGSLIIYLVCSLLELGRCFFFRKLIRW